MKKIVGNQEQYGLLYAAQVSPESAGRIGWFGANEVERQSEAGNRLFNSSGQSGILGTKGERDFIHVGRAIPGNRFETVVSELGNDTGGKQLFLP